MAPVAFMIMALAVATPSAAQVSTGRVDVSVSDSTGKQYNLRLTGPTGFDTILEIMNPRIMRVGARLNF